ncbi:MAG: nucleotide exchange factor GrpE [Clostridia bacterium]|nr:nucleotide exchange factor GrpE [Clostridia bacterium]
MSKKPETSPDTIEEVSEETPEVNEFEVKYQETLDRLLRTTAEYDNFRKRSQKEKEAMYQNAQADFAEKILPVLDNFDRAIAACEDKEDGFFKGVEMVHKQFVEILAGLGITPIPTVGETFNPELHYAVAHEENDDYGENEIIEEFARGYQLKEQVIRPAMVKVAN